MMPHAPARLALLLLLLAPAAVPFAARAQTAPAKESSAPATVEGRVTDGDEGLAGVVVLLVAFERAQRPRTAARTKTDHEGRYRLSVNTPGRYQALPAAPAYVLPDTEQYPPGRTLLLSAGDHVSDVDFRLTRGAVITGRVTDANGQPVVGEPIHLTPHDKTKPTRPFVANLTQRFTTDDRGIYRIYGLPGGRYRVSAGQDAQTGAVHMTGARRFYRRTFHPNAAEEEQGRVVEVAAGGEAANVDIALAPVARTFTAAGRFVGPDGRPAAGVTAGFGTLEAVSRRINSYSGAGQPSNERGEFRIEGLPPGAYVLFAMLEGGPSSEMYSDSVEFVVGDADVTGLEVRLRRGASITGTVTVEGTSDRATVARVLSRLRLAAHTEPGAGSVSPPSAHNIEVGADGSFRLSGLRPGRLRLGMGWPPPTSVRLTRVELNGVAQRERAIELAEGAQVSGVRVVVSYGSAVVRGQVNVINGTLGPNMRLVVYARRVVPGEDQQTRDYGQGAEADSRGRFVIEGLAAGEYEVTARIFSRQGIQPKTARQQVSVPDGGDVTVTLTLDMQ